MILLIDNYDSFVFNLARYAEELGHETVVVRHDAIDVEGVEKIGPEAVILSPGPGTPDDAGICLELVRRFAGSLPILGVCLGHQVIAAAFGARIERAEPVHGRSSWIHHDGRGVFAELPSPFEAARYHSLVVAPTPLPSELEVAATLPDGTIMALRLLDQTRPPVVGVQFHPESVLTRHGHTLLANFLRQSNVQNSKDASPSQAPSVARLT